MAEKVRLRRKDIKRPDEFLTLTGHALTWATQHQQLVLGVGAAVLAVIVAVGVVNAYRGARERDANADLARALTTLKGGDYAAASGELIETSERWDGTGVAPVAGLLGANAAIRAGEADRALTELNRLAGQSDALPTYLRQQLFLAWGAALEAKQQWQEAAAKYEAAAAVAGPYTGEAKLGEARALELAGDTERARELYRQVYEQFPDLPNRDLVGAKL